MLSSGPRVLICFSTTGLFPNHHLIDWVYLTTTVVVLSRNEYRNITKIISNYCPARQPFMEATVLHAFSSSTITADVSSSICHLDGFHNLQYPQLSMVAVSAVFNALYIKLLTYPGQLQWHYYVVEILSCFLPK